MEALGFNRRSEEFAGSVGVKREHVYGLISGKTRPSDTLLIAICCVHGVSRAWLERGEGPMLAPPPTLDESAVLALYRRDLGAMQKRIDDLTHQVSRLAAELGRDKLRGIEASKTAPPRRDLVAERDAKS
jgi:hypothetical protein